MFSPEEPGVQAPHMGHKPEGLRSRRGVPITSSFENQWDLYLRESQRAVENGESTLKGCTQNPLAPDPSAVIAV